MKVVRIINGFSEMTDPFLLVRARAILGQMTDNPHFASPVPTLVDLRDAINAFQQAVEKAQSGNRQDDAVKNELREDLINKLHLLGNYVLFTAANNEVIATSSGFRVSKTPAPRPNIPNPENTVITNGPNRGELDIKSKRVIGAVAYCFEITPFPVTADSKWEISVSSSCKFRFTGLESGREYACRMAAIGSRQQKVYSEVVTRIAL